MDICWCAEPDCIANGCQLRRRNPSPPRAVPPIRWSRPKLSYRRGIITGILAGSLLTAIGFIVVQALLYWMAQR